MMCWVFTILHIAEFILVCVLAYKYGRLRRKKENECYTDYVHGNLILRVYKPEFEYQAIGKVSRDKLLDRGTLSKFYVWALIEK